MSGPVANLEGKDGKWVLPPVIGRDAVWSLSHPPPFFFLQKMERRQPQTQLILEETGNATLAPTESFAPIRSLEMAWKSPLECFESTSWKQKLPLSWAGATLEGYGWCSPQQVTHRKGLMKFLWHVTPFWHIIFRTLQASKRKACACEDHTCESLSRIHPSCKRQAWKTGEVGGCHKTGEVEGCHVGMKITVVTVVIMSLQLLSGQGQGSSRGGPAWGKAQAHHHPLSDLTGRMITFPGRKYGALRGQKSVIPFQWKWMIKEWHWDTTQQMGKKLSNTGGNGVEIAE